MSLNKERVDKERGTSPMRLSHKQQQAKRENRTLKLGREAEAGRTEAQQILRDQYKDLKTDEPEPESWTDVAKAIFNSMIGKTSKPETATEELEEDIEEELEEEFEEITDDEKDAMETPN